MVISLNDVEIDLVEELNFHFNLNDQQLGAINTIVEFLDSDKQSCTLQGSAGVGKTTIVKILLHYLNAHIQKGYLLCAPTHKARVVLQTMCDERAETLHSILNLKPNFDIVNFDARELDFMVDREANSRFKKKIVTIPYKGVLIIDEASMINNDLYQLIINRAKEKECKVLFIGDLAQLQPVKQGEVSKVFQYKSAYHVVLTKVERQKGDNPLLDTLVVLREEPMYKYETSLSADEQIGMVVMPDSKKFLSSIKQSMTADSIVADPYRNRILAYSNTRVRGFNNAMRKILGYEEVGIQKGELLMAYDNMTDGDIPLLVNSCDYVVQSVKEVSIDIPEFGPVPGFKLVIKDLNASDMSVCMKTIEVIRNDLQEYFYQGLAYTMENLRLKAVDAKKKKLSYAGMFWRKFYEMNEHICCMRDLVFENRVVKKKTIDYGYSHTIHKSQGATYENIFVDMSDVMKCSDINELRQLQYVALSRARKKAFILI